MSQSLPSSDRIIDAASLPLEALELDASQVVTGTPSTAAAEVFTIGGVEVGVWEHTPGVSTDVETDEVFVVLSGDATVHLPGGESVEIGPGSVVRLHAGEATRWEVRATVRKVYLAG